MLSMSTLLRKFGGSMSLTVQAISSHPLLIRAVEKMLADMKDYPFLPSALNARDATGLVNIPRLFLLDACSLNTDLGPFAERCRTSSPGSKFLVLLPQSDSNYADEIRLFYWGIDGFVELSETWKTELPQAIRSVLNGQYWVNPQILTAFVKHAQALEQARLLRGNSLTAREGQILRLLMRHLSNKEISRLLLISERTVKFHVSHILAKFGLEDRRGLLPETYFSHESVSRLGRAYQENAGDSRRTGISAPWIARAATAIKFTLPWLPLGFSTFGFVAKAMGFWEKRGLDVTIDRGFGSGRVCVPIDQGQYDFGIVDLGVMMSCVGRGLDLVAVAGLWPISPIGIFSLKEYDIRKPKDLEGQTVGFDVGSGDFQLWPAFVRATGINDGKVKKVVLDSATLNNALIDGRVKAVGNFFNNIAPSLWVQGLEMHSMLYADHGIKTFSLSVACKRATIERRPEICKNFVEGLMEGLKYVYLNPEKSVAIHLESVKEFKGGGVANAKVIEYGQACGTALGIAPAFKQHGLGYMDPGLVKQTAQSVVTYMKVTTVPRIESMYTNRFAGTVTLTDAEWKSTEERLKALARTFGARTIL
jgi:NitT/TauT family transport system substrate-binding protein